MQGRFPVRIASLETALLMVQSKHPDARLTVNSEATLEQFVEYDIQRGAMMVLWEAQ